MLTLTDNARTAVHDLQTQAGVPEGGGLRIAESADQAGSFELALVPAPQPDDTVVEDGGARVFVDAVSSVQLDDRVLDARVDDDGGIGFALAQRR